MGRDVPCDHAACADDAACSDGDTAAHGDVARQPAVIADGDGLAVFQIVQRAVCTPAEVAFLRQVGVHGREKGAARTEEHVVADGDGAGVQYHEIEVGVAPLSKGGVDAVVKLDGALQKRVCAPVGEQLSENCLPLFAVRFRSGVVLL